MALASSSLGSSNRFHRRRRQYLLSRTAVLLGGSPQGRLPSLQAPPYCPTTWLAANFVYIHQSSVSKPLTPPYSGPYAVLERSLKSFKVDLSDRTDIVSVDRLMPHLGSAPLLPASAPRRGRPPSSATSPGSSSLGSG